jgi:phenylacetaldehyde dehydrogenase
MATATVVLEEVSAFLERDHGLLIGGEEVEAQTGERFEVVNPATGETIATAPLGGPEDVDGAVRAAREAFPAWRDLPPKERADLLWRLGHRLTELAGEFGQLETLDNGKPVGEALAVDVPLCADLFKYYAGWATKIEGQVATPSFGSFHTYMRREPVGVVGAIIPWNFPLLMCGYKLGPALAAGCTVVLKPAEQTPLSALRLAEVIGEVGFPPGVVNVVTGFGGPGATLAAHPDVDKITFTGEHTTGQKIVEASKGNLKRVSLELGGKSPTIVFDDADLEAALAATHGAVFFNQGQCCIAGARVFVQEALRDEFTERLTERAGSIRLGSGLDADTDMGPLVSDEQLRRVTGYIDIGRDEGARLLIGGERAQDEGLANGYFVRPTVFADVTPEMRIMRDEIFGPVAMVGSFGDEDEAVAYANDTKFGLAAGIFTRDVGRAHRVAAKIDAGTVWVNTYGMFDAAIPYGGFKLSGFGKELGREALELYLKTKTVWVNLE